MRLSVTCIIVSLVFASCKKSADPVAITPVPGPVPEMHYTDLTGKELLFSKGLQVDINQDGINDISFSTMLVGDPIYQQDKEQYWVYSRIESNLPINTQEKVPVMNKGTLIPINDFQGYTWYKLSFTMLGQKITSADGSVRWEGDWINADHNYLPLQVIKDNLKYNAWLELSFDTVAQKAILHKAAIAKQHGLAVKAGY